MARQTRLNAAATLADAAPGAVPSIIGGLHPRGYDRRLCLYNFKPSSLRKSRPKLAKAQLGRALFRISMHGDSTIPGANTNNNTTPPTTNLTSIVARLQTLMESKGYPLAGSGRVLAFNGANLRDVRWTPANPAHWAQVTSFYGDCTANDSPMTFTSDRAGTVFEFAYFSLGTAGTFEVAIDGGAPETVSFNNVAGVHTFYTKTSLPYAIHTAVITKKTGGTLRYASAEVRPTSGVAISSLGSGGSKVSAWVGTVGGFNDMNTIFNPNVPPADLVFANHFLNDVTAPTSLTQFKADWQTYINRNIALGSDLVIIANNRPGGSTYLNTDPPYRTVLYELADENDLPLVDFGDRIGTFTQAQAAGQMADSLHPTDDLYFANAQMLTPLFA